jgi:hemin uptake protein HemP
MTFNDKKPDTELSSHAESEAPLRTTLSLSRSPGRSAAERGTVRSMTARSGSVSPRSAPARAPAREPAVSLTTITDIVPLKRLTSGRKKVKIAHAGETYLLQVTKANKLILTKPKEPEKGAAASQMNVATEGEV